MSTLPELRNNWPAEDDAVERVPIGQAASAEAECDALFVDLDGTLIATDLLVEGVLLLARTRPALLWRLPRLALRGRAALKRFIAEHVTPEIRTLPFNQDVIEYLQEQRAAGQTLVLATATDVLWARQVAAELELFDGVIASDGKQNLKGAAKLAAIEDYCREQGHARFGYVGDSWADRPIWKKASQRLAVSPPPALRAEIDRLGGKMQVFDTPDRTWRAALRAMRPRQWAKNLLLLLPLLLAHEFTAWGKIATAIWAFVAFSLAASGTYVLNDLLDIDADRSHPRKCRRPLASGDLPAIYGPPLVLGLVGTAATLSVALLPGEFSWLLALYLTTTLLYSCWLKRLVLIDVFVLAGLYTLRIVAGGVATQTPVSEWLLALSLFLFVSLAFGKRYSELRLTAEGDDLAGRRRGYRQDDVRLLESIGPTSGYLAVLVLALYIHGDTVSRLYRHHWPLWLICPLLMYWITRFWLLARRGLLCDDPLVFALKDRGSLAIGVAAAALAAGAIYVP